ncbi:DUF7380 domain-containing protein [Rubellimicrobium aerolatum]|uniref:DUF7380 domain-containing protein n=1 Tax=Rubellimicrobium aerolatum TaxID=490979 RepID=A0ABW0SGW2_9RHOB|nr:hypothetical protein [Rubellimicrobium aerolatum]MBP1807604.1 hypothetical protein [Rubellimicrobium aerolatum]
MNEDTGQQDTEVVKAAQLAKWQMAELKHLDGLDINNLVRAETSADADAYAQLFSAALEDPAKLEAHGPALEMLRAIMWMHESTEQGRPPFGPMLQMGNGARSAAPDDFRGTLVNVILACLEATSHPVVRARLAHLAWFLERRRKDVGLTALDAYIRVIEMLNAGELIARGEQGTLSIAGRDLLAMAFGVSRGLGRPKDQHDQLIALAAGLFRQACAQDEAWPVLRFGELALDHGSMAPEKIGAGIEQFIQGRLNDSQDDRVGNLWHLAGLAYRRAKDEVKTRACQTQEAESYVRLAEHFATMTGGAMLASHWMTTAISSYHGHPEARERRKELRHRLVDLQEGIREQLVPISHETDIGELVEATRDHFSGLDLRTALLRFTILAGPPDPETLVKEARESVAEFPLSSLFSQSYLDADGKTVAKAPGAGLGPDADEEGLEPQIARSESIRRAFAVRGQIEVARATIALEHHVAETDLRELLRWSPAIPPRLLHTMTRGFVRYFEGDMVAALYILTPMVEGLVRKLLKDHGHDVSTLDNATGTQEDRTITALYDALREEMDAIFGRALTEDIRRVFLSKMGPSLRHGVAHALLGDGTPYGEDANYACWLIWKLVIWPLVPHWKEITQPDNHPKEEP